MIRPPRHKFLINESDLNDHTIDDWTNFCRELLQQWIMNGQKKIDGEGKIIELDKTKIGTKTEFTWTVEEEISSQSFTSHPDKLIYFDSMQEVDFGNTVKALDLTEHAMRFVGTWPPKSFQPIFLFFLIYLTVHCTSAIIDIAVNISDMEYIISCLMENVFNVIALLKISICKIKRKSLAKFIDDIRSDFTLDNYYYEEEKMAFIHYNKCSRKFVIVLLVASFVASSMYYFFSLAINIEIVLTNSSYGYRLPYRVWLLIEPTNVVTYVCLCFYQFLIIPTIVFGYIGTDCLFVSLVLHVSGLFSALSYEVKYVLNDSCDREKHLKQLIIKHVRLIRLSESLEEDFNLIILLQLIGTILQFCIVGYDALVRSVDGDMAMLLSFLFIGSAVAGVLLIYCYIGECLIKESSILGDALYLCEWYNISKEEKKLMHICMLRSTKEMRLTSGKFFVLSLTTFTDVLKTSMAYFSVLRTFI